MLAQSLKASVLNKYKKSFLEDFPRMEGKNIIVLGDVGVDEYVMGEVKRISPEAPVPVVEVEREEFRLGLAANVAANISALGGRCHLIGVIGLDRTGLEFRELLKSYNVEDNLLVEDGLRPTTKKMRIMARHQQVVRVDYEKKRFLTSEVESKILKNIESILEAADCLILEDYAKGVLTKSLCQKVINLARGKKLKVLVDPHRSTPIEYYKGANLFKPNSDEALILSGLNADELRDNEDKIFEVGKRLLEQVKSENVIITQGKEGMMLFSKSEIVQLPTYAREVFDVTGAGDTVIAALSLAWASGLSLEKSCVFANFAAGVVVAQVGSVPCKKSDLVNYINSHQ